MVIEEPLLLVGPILGDEHKKTRRVVFEKQHCNNKYPHLQVQTTPMWLSTSLHAYVRTHVFYMLDLAQYATQ